MAGWGKELAYLSPVEGDRSDVEGVTLEKKFRGELIINNRKIMLPTKFYILPKREADTEDDDDRSDSDSDDSTWSESESDCDPLSMDTGSESESDFLDMDVDDAGGSSDSDPEEGAGASPSWDVQDSDERWKILQILLFGKAQDVRGVFQKNVETHKLLKK